MTLLVVPEYVQIEEKICYRWDTPTPTSQMHSAHMCTDCGMWGWWPLCTDFNLAFIHSFNAPQLKAKGCMWAGIVSSGALGDAEEGTSGACFSFSAYETRDLRCHLLRVLRGWLGNGQSWGGMVFFRWRWSRGTGGVGYSSLQEPVKSLCLWSTYCRFDFL